MTTRITIGASIGTRAVGLVVLKGETVLDWQIKSFKKGWSKKKLNAIIQTIITAIFCYKGCMVAIKTPSESKHEGNLNALLCHLETIAKEKGIIMHRYCLYELKRASRANLDNKRDVMRHVTELYPCMYRLYQKELQNRNPYHLKVFEALLAAHCHQIKRE